MTDESQLNIISLQNKIKSEEIAKFEILEEKYYDGDVGALSKTNVIQSSERLVFANKDNVYKDNDIVSTEIHKSLQFLSIKEEQDSLNQSRSFLCKSIDESNCCFKDAMEQSEVLLKESESWMCFVNEKNEQFKLTRQLIPQVEDTHLNWKKSNNFDQNNKKTGSQSIYINDDLVFKRCVLHNDSPITLLPHEVLLRIFSFFSQRELCSYVAPVCSLWFNLSKDSSLWHYIHSIDYEDVNSSLLCKVLVSWCCQATAIELDKRCDLTYSDFQMIFQNCPSIRHLSLEFCSQINNDILNLLGKYLKELTSINIEGCHEISDHSLYYLIGLPLTRINLSYCNRLSDDGAIFLARNFANLHSINLDGIQWITENFIEILVQKHFHSLEELFLDGENLTDYTLRLLSECSKLRVLSFSFCTLMTSDALIFVSQFSKLNDLKLRKGLHFTNESLVGFLKNMSEEQASKFRRLNFGECVSITDECLMYIGKRFFNIIELDLSWCWDVSDEGLSFIINNCHQLKKLHLQGMHEICGSHFSKISSSLKNLIFLDLRQCNKVDDDFIDCLVKRMENLVVLNYYGDMVVNRSNKKINVMS